MIEVLVGRNREGMSNRQDLPTQNQLTEEVKVVRKQGSSAKSWALPRESKERRKRETKKFWVGEVEELKES